MREKLKQEATAIAKDFRMQVSYTDCATTPIPLYERMKEAIEEIDSLQKKLRGTKEALEYEKIRTNLFDTSGREILIGNVVHWTDGGDELTLEKRILTRWDRIAIVDKSPDIKFTVFDSPDEYTRQNKDTFNYGNFIYKETSKYLTIVAENEEEYKKLFSNAGECMAWVETTLSNIKNKE